MRELVPPPAAREDANSTEVLRSWIANGAQWCSLNPHIYRNQSFAEEWAWGLFLSDTVRHLARAISQESGKDSEKVKKEIRKAFLKEIKRPTSAVRGGFFEGEP
ncbi:MAG: DUF5076 domain-containing protein [Alphaproteobacteria bacterium]|nr:DUF5076 domain-containing protein [Alphaproteobacteria bacterium]